MRAYISIFTALCFVFLFTAKGQKAGESLPAWKEGQLDIHHINTGQGDCTFMILPDGTTMMVDAGEHDRAPGPRELSMVPNENLSAGGWIVRYIDYVTRNLDNKAIDYFLLTHFHSDHMGSAKKSRPRSFENGFILSGMTEVGFRKKIHCIIDRDCPNYNWPSELKGKDVKNYLDFLKWTKSKNATKVEKFIVGTKEQVTLKNKRDQYSNFQIRNIAANGEVWTRTGDGSKNHFPELETLEKSEYPSENMCSTVIKLSYGKFDYYTGGDIPGYPYPGDPEWMNVEKPVGKAVGAVEVHVVNHHGYIDSANLEFLQDLQPQVHILQTWVVSQPGPAVFQRLQSQKLYNGARDIFATNITEINQTIIGKSSNDIKGQGHIVVRVAPGGDVYHVLVLDAEDVNEYKIKEIYGPYQCK